MFTWCDLIMRIPLNVNDAYLMLSPRWADFGLAWQIGLLALILIVPVALIVCLCRYELRLVRRSHALGLLGLRLVVLTLLWMVVALQPTVSRFATEMVPSEVLVAVDISQSMDVADTQRTAEETDALASAFAVTPAEVAGWSRKEIVRRVLLPLGLDMLAKLGRHHRVELVGFHETRWSVPPASLDTLFHPGKGDDFGTHATDLRQPLLQEGRTGAAPLRGILVLTDGRHNRGGTPLALAKQLGMLGIPIYPVAIGSKRPPPDLVVAEVQAPGKVFKDSTVSIACRVQAMHLPAQELAVELLVAGKTGGPDQRRKVKHSGGDATYDVAFQLAMEQAGTHALTVRASAAQGGEITLENNLRTTVVRVVEDKAPVLLVDEEARWEYHYLAATLLRDPTLRLDRVLFAPPRLGIAKADDLARLGLPRLHLPAAPADISTPDTLNDYDCIILGDVAPASLRSADRKRLERFVAERGGTLVLVAGKQSMPMAYASQPDAANDPFLKMLPIRAPRVFERKDGFTLRLTPDGKRAQFLQLNPNSGAAAWPDLPAHYWAIVGTRQSGATVLARPMAGDEGPPVDATGLLVQQSYGFGKVLFVGLDSTWRWRYKAGDTYHHRFWGQLVRWAAAERLLPAGNRLVRFGTREPVYQHGQEIELAARLSDAAPAALSPRPIVRVLRHKADKTEEEVAVVPLHANPQQSRLLEGKLRDLDAGAYRVELDAAKLGDPPFTGDAGFTVLPPENAEMLDLSTNWELLQGLAAQSQGLMFTPENVEQVLDLLAQKAQPREIRQDSKPWQDEPLVWWMLGIFVSLLALEWLWRKRLDLP
jgi:hypothetical protein